MGNIYLPEGQRIMTPENREYTSTLSGLEQAMEQGIILEARALMCDSYRNLFVEIAGYRAVIPRDEAVYSPSGEPVKDIAVITRVGKSVCFIVTDIIKESGNVKIVLSRRLAQMECCRNSISLLTNGDVINAAVTHLEPFGAFCDIGCGNIALLPVDCISVSRISHPAERFYCGQEIRCVVKSIDYDTCRVTLTHKELLGTWQENAERFTAGETVTGIVRSIESYGIFIELAPNIAGLAEWCDGVAVGQTVAAYIKSIIPEKMKVKLVIVDASNEEVPFREPEYFFRGKHMAEWRYSPEECTKEVMSVFE